MRRIVPMLTGLIAALGLSGCASLGWFRAIGNIPGVAPSDYAFYNYCGVSSQVYQFRLPQVQSAAVEALKDMGFTNLEPATSLPDGSKAMNLRTPDGRLATITFTPQNALTNVRFTVGPAHVGDELLARDLLRRVSLNFGTLPRDYTPLEATIARRITPPTVMPPEVPGPPPITLQGEGLRPGEQPGPSLEYVAPVTGAGSGIVPQPFDPYRPVYPGTGSYGNLPFIPYTPIPSPSLMPDQPLYP
jgi:hypothetical protein